MDPLRDPAPVLDEHRLEHRRGHLMDEIGTAARAGHSGRPRRAGIVVAVAVAVGLLTGGAALAARELGVGAIWRQQDGSVAIDGSSLQPAYYGRVLTADELESLVSDGKATVSANNRELACQGITLYFDTETERDAYLADFEARHGGDAVTLAPGEDPCAPYADSPRYVRQD